MPHVSKGAIEKLLAHAPEAAVVAPRRDEGAPWEPLFARYDPARVRPVVEAAAADGVRIVWEFEPGFWLNKPSEVQAVLAAVENPASRNLSARVGIDGSMAWSASWARWTSG